MNFHNFQVLIFVTIIVAYSMAQDYERDAKVLGLDSLFGARPAGGVPQIGHPGAVVRPRPPMGYPGGGGRPIGHPAMGYPGGGGRPIGHPGAVVRPGYATGLNRPHVRPALVKPIHPQYFGSSLVRPGLIRKPLIKPAIAQQRPSGLAGLFSWFG